MGFLIRCGYSPNHKCYLVVIGLYKRVCDLSTQWACHTTTHTFLATLDQHASIIDHVVLTTTNVTCNFIVRMTNSTKIRVETTNGNGNQSEIQTITIIHMILQKC